ncbi:hypothetical protein ABIE26_003866 [Pedobacter africanus]|uniref:energy transducer TonB n=1 Tax=Pedobacter africanus TaxID=151894 RepID=UPI00339B1116
MDIFLRNTVKYPKQATENNTQGTVQVSFIIEKDGSIGNFRIDRGKEDGLVLHTRTKKLQPLGCINLKRHKYFINQM